MAKICPPGFICIENMTIIFLILVLILAVVVYYYIINKEPTTNKEVVVIKDNNSSFFPKINFWDFLFPSVFPSNKIIWTHRPI